MRSAGGALPILTLGLLLAGCADGDDMQELLKTSTKSLTVTSSAFQEGKPIPSIHSCDGNDTSPPLQVANVPAGTKTLALIMDDPDAPRGTWTHWTFWNLPKDRTDLPAGADVTQWGAREGKTSGGGTGYEGPCPPSGTHRYFTKVFAVDASLDLAAGASVGDLTKALNRHVMAWGELMGTYTHR